jgi:hypothetical protein
MNVHLPSGADPIALSAVRAPYLEIASALIFTALFWCEPLLQEGRGALFSFADARIGSAAAATYRIE